MKSLRRIGWMCALATGLVTRADLLVNYDSTGSGNTNALAAAFTTPGLAATSLTRGPGLNATQGHSTDAFGSNFGGDQTFDLDEAVNDGTYVGWTVTPSVGVALSVSNVSFHAFVPENQSGGTNFWSPRFVLYSSLTGWGISNEIGRVELNLNAGDGSQHGPLHIPLTGVTELQGATDPVEFRLHIYSRYARNETVSNRPNFWENIGIGADDGQPGASEALSVSGTTSVIPEPHTALLLGLALLAWLGGRPARTR